MQGYIVDIETLTKDNHDFRRVLYTGHHLQLVLMALKPGQSIGVETHTTRDQFFRIEQGEGTALIDGVRRDVRDGDCIVVPAGAKHDLTNTGTKALRLYTLYAPPEHVADVVQATQAEAQASDEAFDGVTSE